MYTNCAPSEYNYVDSLKIIDGNFQDKQVSVSLLAILFLGLAPLHKARVQYNVSDVVAVHDPCEEPFQSQSIPPVGTRSKLAL